MEETNKIRRAVDIVIERWHELAVTEHEGRLYLPASIKRRRADNGLDETPVVLTLLTNEQRVKARQQTRLLEQKLRLDPERDADLCSDLEAYCTLSFALRDAQAPHDQHMPDAEELWRTYDQPSIIELWGVYERWRDVLDPRCGEMTAEEVWRVIVAIKEQRRLDPLAAMPSVAQVSCVLFMAEAALLSTIAPSWVRPSESSTPAPSPQPSSPPSSA